MIKLDPIEETIMLALLTGYLEGVRPLSVLIIAKKESAKTEVVAQFSANDGVLYLNNFTPTAFMDEYIRDFMSYQFYIAAILPNVLLELCPLYLIHEKTIMVYEHIKSRLEWMIELTFQIRRILTL